MCVDVRAAPCLLMGRSGAQVQRIGSHLDAEALAHVQVSSVDAFQGSEREARAVPPPLALSRPLLALALSPCTALILMAPRHPSALRRPSAARACAPPVHS
jgi:hypothetical protein